jgi:hypothetical protein
MGINIGCVYKGTPGLKILIKQLAGRLFIRAGAKVHGSQTQHTYFNTGLTQGSSFHKFLPKDQNTVLR